MCGVKRVWLCIVDGVRGVTQLHGVVYVISPSSSTIKRFLATTRQQLADINVKGLREPCDIAACQRTSQLYVADNRHCVWRVSADGEDIQLWLPKSPSGNLKLWTLSVTAMRLLVTSHDTKQLIQFDAGGDELQHIRLPRYMNPCHAVESPTATFIVSHLNSRQKRNRNQYQVSEVNTEGRVLRQFSHSSLGYTPHIVADSQGNIFLADETSCRILLLDAQLALRHVIIDEHQLNNKSPWRLCYMEHSGQLLVAFDGSSIAVFDVLQR